MDVECLHLGLQQARGPIHLIPVKRYTSANKVWGIVWGLYIVQIEARKFSWEAKWIAWLPTNWNYIRRWECSVAFSSLSRIPGPRIWALHNYSRGIDLHNEAPERKNKPLWTFFRSKPLKHLVSGLWFSIWVYFLNLRVVILSYFQDTLVFECWFMYLIIVLHLLHHLCGDPDYGNQSSSWGHIKLIMSLRGHGDLHLLYSPLSRQDVSALVDVWS